LRQGFRNLFNEQEYKVSESTPEFGQAYAAEQLRRSRHPLRRLIKKFYLDRVLGEIEAGPTIDFGCGAGQLLARLPAGSVGLEVNPHLVEALRQEGFDARLYDAYSDDFSLSSLESGRYRAFTISHVLEHFDDTPAVMHKLWAACARLGVTTIVAIVPGAKGYASDTTHKTFVTREWVRDNGLEQCEGYVLECADYFPIDKASIGDWFVFHELHLVYRRKA
jgi:2-polyprenyl-3-methyl-5-hydroxy-6-metoxy-1,4-benzoquinol methylase